MTLRTIALALIMLLPFSVVAGNGKSQTDNGSAPNGKPFQTLQALISANADTISSNSNAIDALSGEIEGLQLAVDDIEGRLDENELNISEALSRISSAEDKILAIENEILLLNGDIAELQSEITHLQSQLATTRSELTALTTTLNQEVARLEGLIAEGVDTEEVVAIVASSIAPLSAKVATNTSAIMQLQGDVENAEAALQTQLDSLSGELAAVEARVTAIDGGPVVTLRSFELTDTGAADDFSHADFMNAIASLDYQVGEYLFFSGETNDGRAQAYCTNDDSVADLLDAAEVAATFVTTLFQPDNAWFYTNAGGGWRLLDGFNTNFSLRTFRADFSMWSVFSTERVRVTPDDPFELNRVGPFNWSGGTITMTVAGSRLEACGF